MKKPLSPLEKLASTIAHEVILTAIEPLTNEALKKIISNGNDVFDVFAPLIGDTPQILIPFIRMFRGRILEYLTPEAILEQMRDHRPDLTVLETPEGKKWLERQLKILVGLLRKHNLI